MTTVQQEPYSGKAIALFQEMLGAAPTANEQQLTVVRQPSRRSPGKAQRVYQMTFNANWICREAVAVEVISPAPGTGSPMPSKIVLFPVGGLRLA
jgi:hypothetical protein